LLLIRCHVDPTIVKTLLPFQVESICFAIRQQGRLLLADDMGLGKTLQGLAIASYYKKEWPLFIISPSSVKFMWKQSAKRWVSNTIRKLCGDCSDVDDYIQVIENSRQSINRDAKIIISSYDLVSKNIDELASHEFQVVIADESHLLKTGKALRTKSASRLMQNSKRVILLSGTPALSRPSELFSQLQIINPSVFNNFHDFGMRYCAGQETKFGYDYSGFSNMVELRTVLEEKVLIRREKKDVMSQLPSKIREQIILDPSLIELNTKSLRQASNLMKEENLKGMEKRGALLQYFQETSKVKASAVSEYVNDLLESGKKLLVFAHHKSMLDVVEEEITKNKYDFIRIDGTTNSEKRQTLVDRFQNTDECLCALLSITAASTGITLTKASLVIFAELYWNPGILVQAEDRVYRIGQKNSVLIQYLCAKGTADDELWPLVNEKLDVLSKAGLTKESMSDLKCVQTTSHLSALKELIEEDEKTEQKSLS
jgi:SWI/SNF-related matrix-associated actin-dependent regulator of chromatin subfamily A-like protein 1